MQAFVFDWKPDHSSESSIEFNENLSDENGVYNIENTQESRLNTSAPLIDSEDQIKAQPT